MVYRSQHLRRHELDYDRYNFVKRLMSAILAGEPFGYFDEMALHSFLTYKKAWSYADSAVVCPVNSGSRLKVSVYGTISNVLHLPLLDFKYDATNAVDALAYFKKLKAAIAGVTDRKLHLVLDNHTAHKSKLHGTKKYLEENFILHWMPPGSPELNSIEHYWGSYKCRFRKQLQTNPDMKWTQAYFENKVRCVGESFKPEESQNFLRANHAAMLQLLERFGADEDNMSE